MSSCRSHILDQVACLVLKEMSYDPLTGSISWRPGKKWAKTPSGIPLGCKGRKGYLVIYITIAGKTRQYRSHRLAWLLHHGEWPDGTIDHINHNKTDNRIVNLRCISNAENQKNRGMYSNNKSGVMGVHFCNIKNMWIGQHNISGRRHYVGAFESKEAAASAVLESRRKHGFHENHGNN